MVLGTTSDRRTDVRELAGGLDSNDVSDSDIDRIIERADNWVEVQTSNFSWTTSDDEWESVLNASNLMASAEILDGVPQLDVNKIESQRRAARDIIKAINRKDEVQGSGETVDLSKTTGAET